MVLSCMGIFGGRNKYCNASRTYEWTEKSRPSWSSTRRNWARELATAVFRECKATNITIESYLPSKWIFYSALRAHSAPNSKSSVASILFYFTFVDSSMCTQPTHARDDPQHTSHFSAIHTQARALVRVFWARVWFRWCGYFSFKTDFV